MYVNTRCWFFTYVLCSILICFKRTSYLNEYYIINAQLRFQSLYKNQTFIYKDNNIIRICNLDFFIGWPYLFLLTVEYLVFFSFYSFLRYKNSHGVHVCIKSNVQIWITLLYLCLQSLVFYNHYIPNMSYSPETCF